MLFEFLEVDTVYYRTLWSCWICKKSSSRRAAHLLRRSRLGKPAESLVGCIALATVPNIWTNTEYLFLFQIFQFLVRR
jgi:hypothetical protein